MTQYLGNAIEAVLNEPIDYTSVEDGASVPAGRQLIDFLGDARVGIWEASPGVIGGVPNDEIFIVLEGRGEVTFEDTGETIQMVPGSIVRLMAGQRNTWRTFERIRKIAVSIPS